MPCLEECPLAQLRFRLAVVVFRRQLARIGPAEAGIVYLTADGAGVFYQGWFDFCHKFVRTICYHQRRHGLFIALSPRRDIVFD